MAPRQRWGETRSDSSLSKPSVRLSCELCRQRKVKCDKLNPCTNCQRSGTRCVPVERARLPPGRSGKSVRDSGDGDSALRERVSRLEELIEHINEEKAKGKQSRDLSQNAHRNTTELLPDFPRWRHGSNPPPNSHDSSRSEIYRRLLSMRGESQSAEQSQPDLQANSSGTQGLEEGLCQVFLDQVDPFFKILHSPSLSMFLIAGQPYLDYEPGHPAPTALAHTVYYAAACSLKDDECAIKFNIDKKSLVTRYQEQSESSLARADFLTSNDLTVLQAFVLFLLARRSHDQSRRVWTMMSMALRIGQALYLHLPEPPFPVRPFEREMRRRLWAGIGFLDVQASQDRDSEPMMQSSWLTSHPPLNINDSDISFNMDTSPIQESEGFTDMTFTMVTLKAQSISRMLNFSDFTESTNPSISVRQHLVIEFQQNASRLLQHAQPERAPFHWFTRAVAECINSSLQLITLRPLQRIPNFIPPPVRGDRLLQIAVDILEKSEELRHDPRAVSWHWIEYTFVPWHPLAVALAELCECDDFALMERFWAPVERACERLGSIIADSRKGALWKAMEKMMLQAQTRRNGLRDRQSADEYATVSSEISTSLQPVFRPALAMESLMDQNAGVYNPPTTHVTMPEIAGLGPWPVVWDAIDFASVGLENEMSWLNYENFIGGLYENVDYPFMP